MTSADKHQLRPLLRRALAGDPDAWNDFFRGLRVYLHAEVRRTLGPDAQGPLDHSNIVQSCLRRIWKNLDGKSLDAEDDLAVVRLIYWIKTIVHHRSVDELRRFLGNPVRPAGDAVAGAAAAPSEGEAKERDRRAALLAGALNRLPVRQRQVVELFWFERLTDAEISDRLGGSPGALRVLRCRALQKLRGLMGEAHEPAR
jgi:RNA polymerase sigma-70 factor (ECF subfamily)